MYVRPRTASPPPPPGHRPVLTTRPPQNPHDPLSLVSAWLALLPQALMVVYATTLFCTREVECALMLAGQLGCEAANFALKRAIREERPKGIPPPGREREGEADGLTGQTAQ